MRFEYTIRRDIVEVWAGVGSTLYYRMDVFRYPKSNFKQRLRSAKDHLRAKIVKG